ncbi:hypothetical protein ACEZCY_14545 [Streptacidiphilus sp. N1-12]|uniref:Uncharacterized protein n=2 Tax=Streptacidiphilus alkalitolerans TaxID=3342712 RepID=A0ABV6V9S0_9ACTN
MSHPQYGVPRLTGVLVEVATERSRQDLKWGRQNHPDGTGSVNQQEAAVQARTWCKSAFGAGYGTWSDVLAEEVAEANAESDPERLRAELVQVAAVAVAWIEAIDRRDPPENPGRGEQLARAAAAGPVSPMFRELAAASPLPAPAAVPTPLPAATVATGPAPRVLCGDTADKGGSQVVCAKTAGHPSPWHRSLQGDSWRRHLVFSTLRRPGRT